MYKLLLPNKKKIPKSAFVVIMEMKGDIDKSAELVLRTKITYKVIHFQKNNILFYPFSVSSVYNTKAQKRRQTANNNTLPAYPFGLALIFLLLQRLRTTALAQQIPSYSHCSSPDRKICTAFATACGFCVVFFFIFLSNESFFVRIY